MAAAGNGADNLILPGGRKVFGHGFMTDDILLTLWLLIKDVARNEAIKDRLIEIEDIALSADSSSDLVNDLIRVMALIPNIRSFLREAGVQPATDDATIEAAFKSLRQVLWTMFWWPLGDVKWRQKARAASVGLKRIRNSGAPAWERVLQGCEFVAAQGGEHYRDRSNLKHG